MRLNKGQIIKVYVEKTRTPFRLLLIVENVSVGLKKEVTIELNSQDNNFFLRRRLNKGNYGALAEDLIHNFYHKVELKSGQSTIYELDFNVADDDLTRRIQCSTTFTNVMGKDIINVATFEGDKQGLRMTKDFAPLLDSMV